MRDYLFWKTMPPVLFDWIIAKDVMEHVVELSEILIHLMRTTRNLFIVVPLSDQYSEPYVVPDYEKDITHRHRMPLEAWINAVQLAGEEAGGQCHVDGYHRVEGIKDNYFKPGLEKANGFIVARRF